MSELKNRIESVYFENHNLNISIYKDNKEIDQEKNLFYFDDFKQNSSSKISCIIYLLIMSEEFKDNIRLDFSEPKNMVKFINLKRGILSNSITFSEYMFDTIVPKMNKYYRYIQTQNGNIQNPNASLNKITLLSVNKIKNQLKVLKIIYGGWSGRPNDILVTGMVPRLKEYDGKHGCTNKEKNRLIKEFVDNELLTIEILASKKGVCITL